MSSKQKVSVIGLGYVGLPLAVAIQKSGKYDLAGFDIAQDKVDDINKGIPSIVDEEVERELKKYPVHATTDESALEANDIYIIAVPTPVHDDYSPNYGPVIGASRTVAKHMKKGATVVLESTVNPGTCEEVVLPVLEEVSGLKGGIDFNLSHCPERINPGDSKWNVYNIPRNIGSLDPVRNKEIADFYRDVIDAQVNEVSTLKVAESTKIIENTFRDINIAYVNELAKSFDAMEIDLHETIKAASNKPFGYMPHWPGAGVGGHCIAVDPYYLIKRAEKAKFNHRFLKEARDINNSMPAYTAQRLLLALNEAGMPLKGTKVALLGLAYKPDVADLRESPSFEIAEQIEQLGGELIKFDPYFEEYSDRSSLEEVLKDADAIVLATAHKEFLKLDAKKLEKHTIHAVVDGRNALDKQSFANSKIIYKGIGR